MWVKSTFSHLFLIIPKSTCTHTDSLQYELEVIDFHCSRLIRYWTINTATCTTEPRYTFLGNKDASRMNYSYLSYYTDNVQIFTMDWSFRIVTVSELSQFQNCHSWRKTRLCHVEFKIIKHSNTTTTNTNTGCRWRYDG